MTNAIMIIKPYKYAGTWVFDDENTGLVREPFVSGADDIIDVMVGDIEGSEAGFALTLSHLEFPGHELELVRQHEEAGGCMLVLVAPKLSMRNRLEKRAMFA